MSVAAFTWAFGLDIPATEKLVLLCLADYANQDGECWPKQDTVAQRCSIHRSTVVRALGSLRDRGLLRSCDDRAPGAPQGAIRYYLCIPQSAQMPADAERASAGAQCNSADAECARGLAHNASPPDAERASHIEPSMNRQREPSLKRLRASEIEHDRFAEFWAVYPRKVDRKKANEAFVRAIKRKADPAAIIAGAKRYALERGGQDPAFTKHASSWLNGDCWLNAPDIPQWSSAAPRMSRLEDAA